MVGDEALIESIVSSNGKAISFDKLICTPDMNKVMKDAWQFYRMMLGLFMSSC